MDPDLLFKIVLAASAITMAAVISYWYSQRELRGPLRHKPVQTGGENSGELNLETLAILNAIPETPIVVGKDRSVFLPRARAIAWGLIQDDQLVHPVALELVEKVENNGGAFEDDIVLAPGQIPGSGQVHLHLQAARLAAGRILVLVTDTSEAHRVEAIRQAFVANVSHELKTPVGAITLLAETIKENPGESALVEHFASSLHDQAQRLSALVSDIISLNRLEDSVHLVEPQSLELSELLLELLDEMRAPLNLAGLNTEVVVRGKAQMLGSRAQLLMAVRNLWQNAINYTEGHEDLRLTLSVEEHSGAHWALVQMRDHGPGIALELRERIFERFFRADPARARETGGTGLGLAIVKHVARNHGGDIEVSDAQGGGSLFTLRLPVTEAEILTKPQRYTSQNRQKTLEASK